MIAQTVAHDQISGKLGESGIGVAYRIRHLKLGCGVALKLRSREALHEE